jgi:DNA mismatch repair ATPase MutS
MEDARPGQLVKREVTQILSPGTHFDERMLSAERNNYLAAVAKNGKCFGLALVDLTTGSFKTTELESEAALLTELDRLHPAEVVLPSEASDLHELLRPACKILQPYDDWVFAPETAQFTVRDHFKVASLDGFGLKHRLAAIGAAGAVLHYLTQHLRRDVTHLTACSCYETSDYLKLDTTTLRYLEILEPLHRDASRNATLYGALNRTVTPMGARCLRDWLSQPLANVEEIRRRQDAVESFTQNGESLESFRKQLTEVRDLERTIGRLSLGSGNARDLLALRMGLEQVPPLQSALSALAPLHSTGTQLLKEEYDPHAVGYGDHGPIYDQFRGSGHEAIAFLVHMRTGEALGALFHPQIGEIDLIWGDEGTTPARGYGLAKLVKYHPEVLDHLPEQLPTMPVSVANENTVQLDSEKYHAVVRLNWKGNPKRWLLTAFEKRDPSQAGRTMDVASAPDWPESAGTTQLPPPQGGSGEKLREGPTRVKSSSMLSQLTTEITALPHLVELIARAICDEPPLAVKEGGLIRDGFDPALDELRSAMRDGKDWIARLQQQEIERTGISSLKVRFNSVFGYFIEVTKSNLDKVPAQYVRKQTIANGERFITPELKEMEGKILGAEERSVKLEYELFLKVREEVLAYLKAIQQTAQALAQLDVLASFAETARLFDYTRPDVRDEGVLEIRDGRHPVLEQSLTEERFVPNETMLASTSTEVGRGVLTASPDGSLRTAKPASPQIALITGPNMAGKSTYIRQVALLALLAHTGSFVPAKQARVDLLDRIFTRIGASDDLARGQSTFMVEMSETANILNHATPRSLIILDEIGRGTSTFDGLSLAWSIVEHLHNQVGAKTLFATHYHELTELAGRLPRLRNYNVAVREWNDQIVFLRKIVEGGTDKSYGIQVARPRRCAKACAGTRQGDSAQPRGIRTHAGRKRPASVASSR